MKKIILLFLLSTTIQLIAQNKKPQPLHMLSSELSITGMMNNTYWSLGVKYQSEETPLTKAENVIDSIDYYLSKKSTSKNSSYYYIKKYRNNLDGLFSYYKYLGLNESGPFYCNGSVPCFFAQSKDYGLTLVITNTCVSKILNTLRFTPKQRASKIIVSYILPALKAFDKYFYDNNIKYFGFSLSYGSQDFTDKSSLAIKPEWVCVVCSTKTIKQYSEGEISEDELVNLADIYVQDRDMFTEIKKIKIKIE